MAGESRILRERLIDARFALDLDESDRPHYGSAAIIAQTTEVTAYPTGSTSTAVMFGMLPVNIDALEQEGAGASYTAISSNAFFALNLGTQVPDVGTTVVCHSVGGRFCFRFDG